MTRETDKRVENVSDLTRLSASTRAAARKFSADSLQIIQVAPNKGIYTLIDKWERLSIAVSADYAQHIK